MVRKKKKKKSIFWNVISIIIILTLIISNICIYNINNHQENHLKELEKTLEEKNKQNEFINNHKQDLETIKSLKQEILGQQNKLEEFGKQIDSFTKTLIENQEKLDKLES